MISPELLSLLRCPLSGQPLAMADQVVMDRLEASRTAGTLRNRSGEPVAHPLSAGLLRRDGKLLYAIIDNLPVLVPDEAIEIPNAI